MITTVTTVATIIVANYLFQTGNFPLVIIAFDMHPKRVGQR